MREFKCGKGSQLSDSALTENDLGATLLKSA